MEFFHPNLMQVDKHTMPMMMMIINLINLSTMVYKMVNMLLMKYASKG